MLTGKLLLALHYNLIYGKELEIKGIRKNVHSFNSFLMNYRKLKPLLSDNHFSFRS